MLIALRLVCSSLPSITKYFLVVPLSFIFYPFDTKTQWCFSLFFKGLVTWRSRPSSLTRRNSATLHSSALKIKHIKRSTRCSPSPISLLSARETFFSFYTLHPQQDFRRVPITEEKRAKEEAVLAPVPALLYGCVCLCWYLVQRTQRWLVHVNLGFCLCVFHAFPHWTFFPCCKGHLKVMWHWLLECVACLHDASPFRDVLVLVGGPPTMLLSVCCR